uniref:hypothetical protein n=1 Tax=Streptomyces sp. CHD11 TaxID=2741325 RepID=UPI0027E576B2|nr:hypothetical protein [Streptomyces sp. CHD11]
MSENSTSATDLTSQYTAQVAGDLERNVEEQERVTAEIASLQKQLTVLQHDHAILVNMQQALGLVTAPAGSAGSAGSAGTADASATPGADAAPGGASVPAPRTRGGAGSGTGKPKRAGKAAALTAPGKAARKPGAAKAQRSGAQGAGTRPAKSTRASAKQAPKAPSATGPTGARGAGKDGPKLVDLVRSHLREQGAPRSAAEVTDALGKAHPERTIRTTVVRSTLEGLVARNQAQRTKQGSSVFYTTPDTTSETAAGTAGRAPESDGGQS